MFQVREAKCNSQGLFMLKKLKFGMTKSGRLSSRTNLSLKASKNKNFDKSWSDWLNVVSHFYKSKGISRAEVSPVFVSRHHDNRPYISVKVFGEDIVALLDSGASISILGNQARPFLKRFKAVLDRDCDRHVTTADGRKQVVWGQLDLPICVHGICGVVKFLVVPSIEHGLILGSDFCRQFSLSIDFKNNKWSVHSSICNRDIGVIASSCLVDVSTVAPARESRFTEGQQRQIASVVESFEEISSRDGILGRTDKLIHEIDTGSAKPFRQRQYLMSPFMLRQLNLELDKMLEQGVIEPSHGPWNSPVLLVKKSSGEYRFCFDGRMLNSVTKPDRYPLPRVDRILNMLRDARFISSLDLRSAFWQIKLHESSKDKTGFSVPGRGMFRFCVMPFGLCNSAQTQQRLMDTLFGPKFEPNVFCYLDDIIVVTKTFEHHIELLKQVQRVLKEANLTVNIQKCEFFRPSLKYLGFIVDPDGLRTDPGKVESMVNYQRPKTSTEVKRFVSMCSWYRRFVKDFSTLVSPLNDLLKGKGKRQNITWTREAEEAFLEIKKALVSAPILRSPDFSKRFTIQCDASLTGLGGVLTQDVDGEEVVVAYCSRSLSRTERNYTVTERELLAVLFSIDKFRPYIEGTRFTVITDHYSLLWLNKLREPTGKLARWAVKLASHSFDLVHRKGSQHVVPDALSRIPAPEVGVLDIDLGEVDDWYVNHRQKILQFPEKYLCWQVRGEHIYKHVSSRLPLKTNISEWKLLVPQAQREKIIRSCHDSPTSSHFGYYKTMSRIQISYYWPKMRRDVLRYLRSCKICGAQKSLNTAPAGLMGGDKRVSHPWQIIAVDIMGPFPRSSRGNQYLLVVSDWLTKYTLLCPMRKAISSTIIRFMEDRVFLVWGAPQFIICDNGSQFAGREFKKLSETYKIQKIWFNARYHPQCNFVERVNKTVGTSIRSYIVENHKSWDQEIYKIQFAINTACHEVTGFSPSYLNFGRNTPIRGDYYGEVTSTADFELLPGDRGAYAEELGQLVDLYEDVARRLTRAYQRNAGRYNLRKRDIVFAVGDRVWRRNKVLSDAANHFSAKLAPKYVLCTVKKRVSRLVYSLTNKDGSYAGEWHVKDLKPYLGSNSDVSVS